MPLIQIQLFRNPKIFQKSKSFFSICEICIKFPILWRKRWASEINKQYINKQSQDNILLRQIFLNWSSFRYIKRIWQSYCRVDLSSVTDPLTFWLSMSVLTWGFLCIYVTDVFAICNFGNKSAMRLIFFPKMFKIWKI